MKTSFGLMNILLKHDSKPRIEHLVFENSGRSHKHNEYESFFVISGKGKVFVNEIIHIVKEGDLVVIPPNAAHWMEPTEGHLEGLLWYHKEPLKLKS